MAQDGETQTPPNPPPSSEIKKPLSEAAQRALKEAELRRQNQTPGTPAPPKEIGGREGPDPVRYKDWEKNGLISDF